ncbi:DUF5107 domain-containing protein [Bacillus pinisoli]|uniref:DUF5107 domain-containing protein n=1 Tax=Bacillus pinisoli TaxID=2901866 RepID=UPI001FF17A18|nr:DUF5107 domain-containing protein [Bacillus pinisoli]
MKESMYKGIKSIVLENEWIIATFLPDYGSKLASFIDKVTNEERLFQSAEESLTIPPYGADFSKFDSSGFDEVFPSIDQCLYPVSGEVVPDHGEVWAMPWNYEIEDQSIMFSVESQVFPYTLEKKAYLDGNRLCLEYKVINRSKNEFYFIWTPHALLRCNEATKIVLPSALNEVMSVEHGTEHLGEWGTRHSYPVTQSLKTGQLLDLSKMEPVTANNCEKFYFTNKLQEGKCGIIQEDTNRTLTYYYPADKIPYLGIWKTQGGYRGDYNLALEPCTGVYDSVYVAKSIRKVSTVEGNGTFNWWFHIEVGGK